MYHALIAGLILLTGVQIASAQQTVANDANAEAKRAYELGRTAIDKQDGEEAVKQLSKAVKQFPKNAEFRYALSEAYEVAGKPGDAWFQIRQAVRSSPKSRKSHLRFRFFWKSLVQKGAFNVGETKAHVQKSAGKPDRVIKGTGGEQWAYAYMNVNFLKDRVHSIMDVRGMALAMLKPQDVVQFEVDEASWTLVQRRISFYDASQTYIPRGQNGLNWSEMLMAVRFFSATKNSMTVDKLLEKFKTDSSESYIDATYKVVERKVGDVIYEMTAKDKAGFQIHVVGAIIAGRADVHHVIHFVRGKRTDASRDGWIEFMRNVNLESTTSPD